MINLLPAIDFHCHFNSGTKKEQQTSEIYKCDLEFLMSERKRLNVIAAFMSSFGSILEQGSAVSENEALERLVTERDDVFEWAVLDPRLDGCFEQVDRQLANVKVAGIKIHSCIHGYPIEEYADAIFGFANERGAAVLMHPDNIEKMVEYADKYQKMKLIIAHLGSLEHIEAISKAKYGNIYTDTSGIASSKNNVIEYAVEHIGADKIFFGTDTYSVAFQRGRIEFANISEEDKRKILFENVIAFLRGVGKSDTAEKVEILTK